MLKIVILKSLKEDLNMLHDLLLCMGWETQRHTDVSSSHMNR